jgi:recombination protein RecA
LTAIAECQRAGGQAVFIDAEHALSKEWCKALGVNFDELIVCQPESGEEALNIMEKFIDTNSVDIIVLDSVAALVTKAEIEGEMGDQHMALLARLMSGALKKLTPKVSRTNIACVFINQLRANIGAYGNPEITPGGKALKYFASLRLKVGKVSQSDKKDSSGQKIGHRLKVTCIKNKVAAPFKEAEFDLYYLKGIDQSSEVSTLATQKGVVSRPNNRKYEYGKYVWTSKAEYEDALNSDKALMEEIKQKTIEAITKGVADVEVGSTNVQNINGALVDVTTGEVLDAEAAQDGEVAE